MNNGKHQMVMLISSILHITYARQITLLVVLRTLILEMHLKVVQVIVQWVMLLVMYRDNYILV
nr:MAG TPA: hypothetical protein [Caudoviricetes sp.]